MRRFVLALLLMATFATTSRGAEPGEDLSICIITIERGDAVFEKFAHNVVWIHDASSNSDIVYNWGVFDFSERGFYLKYALGHMDYLMTADPLPDTIDWYRGANRSMWAQELNLSPAQRVKVSNYCQWHALPENCVYRYNYYTDNCSTRVRDVIDLAVNGQLKRQLDPQPTGVTFRWHTRRLTQDSIFWYTLLNTALGPAVDRPISQWEECFLPVRMRDYLRAATIRDRSGNETPLVKREFTVFQGTRGPEPTAPPPRRWIAYYFLAGALVGGMLEGLRRWATHRRAGRIALGVTLSLCTFIVGLCGAMGLWAWFFTDHLAAWRNENLFGYSPLALPIAFIVPALIRRSPRYAKIAMNLALAVAASTLIGVIASPVLPQQNAEPMALMLPINLALAWSMWQYNKTAHA